MSLLIAGTVLYLFILAGGVLYALLFGGREERLAGTIILVGAVVSEIVAQTVGTNWASPQYGIMLVDALVLVALIALAGKSRRFWPLWAAAFQLVGTLTHVGFILQTSVVAMAYATTQPIWAFPLIVTVAVGTWTHRQAMKRQPR